MRFEPVDEFCCLFCGRSGSAAKKADAALGMPLVRFISATSRRSRLASSLSSLLTPSLIPPSISACPAQFITVSSVPTPKISVTCLAHSLRLLKSGRRCPNIPIACSLISFGYFPGFFPFAVNPFLLSSVFRTSSFQFAKSITLRQTRGGSGISFCKALFTKGTKISNILDAEEIDEDCPFFRFGL
jgi:hypothetical protein